MKQTVHSPVKSMQGNTVVKGLAAAAVIAAGVAFWMYNTDAATSTGNIVLQGTVAPTVSITVTPQGSYNNLNITTQTTVSNLRVATVSETSNVAYTVKVESANVKAGSRCATATSPCLWYSGTNNGIQTDLSIASSGITLSSGEYQYKSGSAAPSGTTPEDVNITYTIGQAYPAGTYTETLTFTITSV